LPEALFSAHQRNLKKGKDDQSNPGTLFRQTFVFASSFLTQPEASAFGITASES
jgi:hypothetical protein